MDRQELNYDDFPPRRHLPHGLGQALPRRGAGPPRYGRWFLDRPHAGHQSANSANSSTPPATSPSPKSRRTRTTIPARCRTCSMPARWCSLRRASGRSAQLARWWIFKFGANWRRPYGPRSSINGLDDHPVVHVAYRTPKLMRNGPARICRPKPSGNSPRAAASTAPIRLGRRIHARRQAHGQYLAGRISAPESLHRRF